uniref:Transmembrane protein 140 n=1 Tax=Amazona collaria TaxID=241587 RepID=A0A8B9IRJ5_9PSIT
MGLLQQRCTGHLLCAPSLLKAARTLALMLHVLLWEARNLVNLPDKRIGFYIFCLWNETAQELQCLDYKLELVRVCVGTCPLLSIFYPMFFAHAKCAEEKEGWKMILIILIIKMSILSGGLGMFLFQSSLCYGFTFSPPPCTSAGLSAHTLISKLFDRTNCDLRSCGFHTDITAVSFPDMHRKRIGAPVLCCLE